MELNYANILINHSKPICHAMLSHFSCVWFFGSARLLCPWFLQARILEWLAVPSFRDWIASIMSPCIGRQILYQMASLTQCTWVWVNSGSWWWTAKPGVLQSMGSQRVRHDWVIEPNWILMINNIFLWTKNGSIWALSTICKDDLIQNNYQIFPHKERIVMSLKTQDIGIWIIILTSDISQVYFVILIITLLYVLWITLLALIQILTDKSPCFPDVTHENSHKLVKGNWDLFIQSNGYFK